MWSEMARQSCSGAKMSVRRATEPANLMLLGSEYSEMVSSAAIEHSFHGFYECRHAWTSVFCRLLACYECSENPLFFFSSFFIFSRLTIWVMNHLCTLFLFLFLLCPREKAASEMPYVARATALLLTCLMASLVNLLQDLLVNHKGSLMPTLPLCFASDIRETSAHIGFRLIRILVL